MKRTVITLTSLFFCLFLTAEEQVHILKEKETLYGLSIKYGVSYKEIMDYNDISDPSSLPTGLEIKIPGKAADFFTYTVKKNDSLWRLAREFDTSVESIKTLNDLSSDQLRLGQTLRIPGLPSAAETADTADSGTADAIEPENEAPQPPDPDREPDVAAVKSDLFWPVDGVVHELAGITPGVKIHAEDGSPVYSIASGKVVRIQSFLNRGIYIFVQSANNTVYCYGGLGSVSVNRDEVLKPGMLLGTLEVNKEEGEAVCYFTVLNNNINIDPKNAPRI